MWIISELRFICDFWILFFFSIVVKISPDFSHLFFFFACCCCEMLQFVKICLWPIAACSIWHAIIFNFPRISFTLYYHLFFFLCKVSSVSVDSHSGIIIPATLSDLILIKCPPISFVISLYCKWYCSKYVLHLLIFLCCFCCYPIDCLIFSLKKIWVLLLLFLYFWPCLNVIFSK